jgi:hypothetical protein
MRRPDIELPERAAQFVERHPEVVERLAGEPADPDTAVIRTAVRAKIRERRAAFDPEAARAGGQAFLARYSL